MISILLCAVACQAPDAPGSGPGPSTSDTIPVETTPSTPPTATGGTGDTGPVVPTFDCDTVPTSVGAVRVVPGAKAYHDVAFTSDGYLLGNSLFDDLLAVDFQGNVGVYVPNTGGMEQMTWLPDGDLAIASATYGITRVSAGGAVSVINSDIHPYGLITGPDGMLYSANQSKVHRIDPVTGESEILVPNGLLERGSPRVINFSLDYRKLYIGTYSGSQGRIYSVELDANLDPIGLPKVFASGVGVGDYHDALGVDVCGYLYVPDYSTTALYRISPSGDQVQTLLNEGFITRDYGHGLDWGNDVGGWRSDALYLAQPYHNNNVTEVVIGVPSRDSGIVGIHLPQ